VVIRLLSQSQPEVKLASCPAPSNPDALSAGMERAMNIDLALEGFALLYLFSTLFGGAAHIVLAPSSTRWMWLIGSLAFFVGGFVASEVFFATATVADVQPFIGGLAVDESLLGGLVLGLPAALITWYVVRQRRPQIV
jgi:hypothetical protein